MSRADELRAQLAVAEKEEALTEAKTNGSLSEDDLRALKDDVRATRALSRASRDYAKAEAARTAAEGDAEATARVDAEFALLDKVTARAAKHLGLSAADLKKARTPATPEVAPGDAVASAAPATAKNGRK